MLNSRRELPIHHSGDIPMRMRRKKKDGIWCGYVWITDPATGKGRQIEFSLGTTNDRQAQINLGKMLAEIEMGNLPGRKNMTFRKIAEQWAKNPVSVKGKDHGTEDNLRILNATLIPYFGKMKVRDITREVVKEYLTTMEADSRPQTEHFRKTSREHGGKSQSTLEKELRVLKWVMQSASKTWELPYWEFRNKEKPKEEVLTFEQIELMIDALKDSSSSYGLEYQRIAWVMVYTGLDVGDVVNLTRSNFKDGLITGKRGKTKKTYQIGICGKLKEVLSFRVMPFDPEEPLFKVPGSKSTYTAINRAFKRAGLGQFHSKSLRDFYASVLFNNGFSELFIQQHLGHAPGSAQTKKYTHQFRESLGRAAQAFDDLDSHSGKTLGSGSQE